jgi:hypothetical protein
MDITVIYENTDVSSEVISYERDKAICTGVGIVRVVFKREVSFTPTLYKKIIIYEGGTKKGTYYIHTIDRELPSNQLVLSCQDASIKLQNYFIAENYFIDYPSSSDYWIKKFLTEATVSYEFDGVSTGSLMSNDTSLGMSTCMDVMVTLCQMNGWYFYFDEENICHIGKLHVDTGNASSTVDDTQILNFSTNTNDRLFRNRVLVWGNGDPTSNKWVFADLDWHGQYENEYGPNDIRTVVIANSNIRNVGTANSAASLALKEFSKTTFEVAVELVGVYSFDLGDYIAVNSNFLQTTGIITTISSSMSSGGLYTRVILNQRCPRLFAFFDYGGYVYVGTQGAGVWRKPLEFSNTWLNFSEGLTDLNIVDLAVDRGVYACVSDQGNLFVRSDATIWQKYSPSLTDRLTEVDGEKITTTYPAASGVCNAVTIDKTTGEVIAPFSLRVTNSGDPSRSWIYYLQGMTGTNYQYEDDDEIPGYTIIDIDNNGSQNIVSTVCNYSGELWLWNNQPGQSNIYGEQSDLPLATESGFTSLYLQTGQQGSPLNADVALLGDGKYIYSLNVHNWPYSNPPYNYLDVSPTKTSSGIAAVGSINKQFNGTASLGTMNLHSALSVGNQTLVFPYYDTEKQCNAYFQQSLLVGDSEPYITYTYNQDSLLGSAFSIEKGSRYVYTLYSIDGVNSVYINYYDPDSGYIGYVGSASVPATVHGGTLDPYLYTLNEKGAVHGDFVSWVLEAWYDGATYVDPDPEIGVNTDWIAAHYVLFYNVKTNQITVQPITGEWTDPYEMITIYYDENTDSGYGDDHLVTLRPYIEYPDGDVLTKVYRVSPYHPVELVYASTFYETKAIITNQEHCVLAVDDYYNLRYIDVDTLGILRTIPHRHQNDTPEPISTSPAFIVAHQMTKEGSVFYYNADLGNMNRIGLYGEDDYIYDLQIFPNFELFEGQPGTVYSAEISERMSYAELMYDCFCLHIYTLVRYELDGHYYTSNRIVAKVIASLGERITKKVNYTKFIRNRKQIQLGYRDNQYSTSMHTPTPYRVESSISSPVAVFGGTAYSGMMFTGQTTTGETVSGIQTGWNQSKLLVSPFGYKGTYTDLVMNGLQSYVNDVRSFNAVTPVVESGVVTSGTKLSNIVMFTQPSSTVISSGIESYLHILDVSTIPDYGGAIVVSGLIGQSTIEAVFSGYANHIETTHTQDVPYMFVSISGVPPRFYQKDYYDEGMTPTTFLDVTGNLPNCAINCIRCDDQV